METSHNLHGPSVAQVEVKRSLARIKDAVAQGQDTPSRIVLRSLLTHIVLFNSVHFYPDTCALRYFGKLLSFSHHPVEISSV